MESGAENVPSGSAAHLLSRLSAPRPRIFADSNFLRDFTSATVTPQAIALTTIFYVMNFLSGLNNCLSWSINPHALAMAGVSSRFQAVIEALPTTIRKQFEALQAREIPGPTFPSPSP